MAATNNTKERIVRLTTYAEGLKHRLSGEIPSKHKAAPEAFRSMVETDLRKTLATIEKLKGL